MSTATANRRKNVNQDTAIEYDESWVKKLLNSSEPEGTVDKPRDKKLRNEKQSQSDILHNDIVRIENSIRKHSQSIKLSQERAAKQKRPTAKEPSANRASAIEKQIMAFAIKKKMQQVIPA